MLSKLSLAAGAASAVTDFTPNSKTCSTFGTWFADEAEFSAGINMNVAIVFSMLEAEVFGLDDKVELCYKACIHAGDNAKHGCCTYDNS